MSPRMVHFGHSCQYVHEERSANSGVNDACQDKLSKGGGGGGEGGKGREGGERCSLVCQLSPNPREKVSVWGDRHYSP